MLGRMTARALFRLRLPDGSVRLASGSPEAGATALLDPAASIDGLLGAGGGALWERVAEENRRTALGDARYRVTTYVGQYVERDETNEAGTDTRETP